MAGDEDEDEDDGEDRDDMRTVTTSPTSSCVPATSGSALVGIICTCPASRACCTCFFDGMSAGKAVRRKARTTVDSDTVAVCSVRTATMPFMLVNSTSGSFAAISGTAGFSRLRFMVPSLKAP